MSILTAIPPRTPWHIRLALSVPIVGWMARDVLYGDRSNLWFALVIIASVWIMAVASFGIVALYLPMVALVPVCFGMLIWLTSG